MKATIVGVDPQQKGRLGRSPERGPRVRIGPKELPSSVCEIIRRLMSEGEVSIGCAAFVAGVSKRTLQRRLAQSGIEYSALVDTMRLSRALELIENPALRLMEAATALGYSDAANFVRAFRRWTGVSPSQFRTMSREKRAAILAARSNLNLHGSPPSGA